jgi:mannose-6-phosphate isomerase-like protein (cupin superfamily)
MSSITYPQDRTGVARQGRALEILLHADQADGTTSVVDCAAPAGTPGPPLHLHPASDETFVVLSGSLLVYVGGETALVRDGGLVHISRGTQHTFATPPGVSARFLTIHTPGGFERFHTAAAQAVAERGAPLSGHELGVLASEFDWQLAGPPRVLLPNGDLAPAR